MAKKLRLQLFIEVRIRLWFHNFMRPLAVNDYQANRSTSFEEVRQLVDIRPFWMNEVDPIEYAADNSQASW